MDDGSHRLVLAMTLAAVAFMLAWLFVRGG